MVHLVTKSIKNFKVFSQKLAKLVLFVMIILHFKDPGHPWDWIPSGGGQDYRAEEWDGEKISKLELNAASPFARNSATEYIFPL